MNKFKLFIISMLLFGTLNVAAKDYPASLFGVKSEGITLNTRSIQKAIDFISENGGGRLIFYVGRYLTGSIRLRSNVTIHLEEGAILVGTPMVYDYFAVNGIKAMIIADGQKNIGITGKGVIDGQGAEVAEQVNMQIQKGYLRESVAQASPALIAMNNCSTITLNQINLLNASGNIQSYSGCKNLTIDSLTVKSMTLKGTKGLILTGCNEVKMSNIYFETVGEEICIDGTSENVSAVNCKNPDGKILQLKKR